MEGCERAGAMKQRSEADIAASVVAWLEGRGWAVYQECKLRGLHDTRADIVAVQNQQAMVVECKTRYSLEVLSQAYAWRHTATFVAIAVPRPAGESHSGRGVHELAREVCSWRGIGVIEVGHNVVQRIAPRATDVGYASPWLDAVTEDNQTPAKAGTNRGGYFTPFRGTVEKLTAYVAEHPGESLRDIVAAVPNHYASKASAMAAIEKMLRKGVIKGIELRREHGRSHLFPACA